MNVKRTLEFRALPAVERMEYTPVVDAREALNVCLELEPLVPRLGWETMEKVSDSV